MKHNKRWNAMRLAFGVLLAACGSSAVQASSPVCVTLPGQTWISEERIKAIFGVSEYLRADFKVSQTRCYEFYAIKKNGDIVEAYYHPVTGELVKRNVLFHAPQGEPGAANSAGAAGTSGQAALRGHASSK